MLRCLIIDHFDSFTYNIVAWLKVDKRITIEVIRYAERIDNYNFDLLILSPGPNSPQNYPKTIELLDRFKERPILGICLGMQIIMHYFGAKISTYTPPLHGKQSDLIITNKNPIFINIENIKVARYHSLACFDVKTPIEILATDKNNLPMAISIAPKILGLQFHPESFLTEQSEIIRNNIYNWVLG